MDEGVKVSVTRHGKECNMNIRYAVLDNEILHEALHPSPLNPSAPACHQKHSQDKVFILPCWEQEWFGERYFCCQTGILIHKSQWLLHIHALLALKNYSFCADCTFLLRMAPRINSDYFPTQLQMSDFCGRRGVLQVREEEPVRQQSQNTTNG